MDTQLLVNDLRDEAEERASVTREALTWDGTRYESNQRVKGPRGGVDCLTFIVSVFESAGLVPRIDIPHYSATWHLHKTEELYLNGVRRFCRELIAEPGKIPPRLGEGDIVMFQIGRCYSHAAIIIAWPIVIGAYFGRSVFQVNAERDADLRGRKRKFFSIWRG